MSPRARLVFFVICVVVAAICIRLGFWQRARLAQRRAANAAILGARSLPAAALGIASWRIVDQQRASARGQYDHDREMLLRNHVLNGVPGIVVVTPLLRGSIDSAVLVLRGFVPSADGSSAPALDSLREEGEQLVEGLAMRLKARPDSGQVLERDGRVTWRALDVAAVRQRLPYPVSGVAIRQAPSPALPSFPRRLPPDALDDGPHWSYMMQWFAFATIAVVMGLVMLLRRRVPEWSEPTDAAPPATGTRPSPHL